MRKVLVLAVVLGVTVRCSDCACDGGDARADAVDAQTDGADAWVPLEPTLWPAGATFEARGRVAEALSLAERLLPWVSHVTKEARPVVGGLAGFGLGNGHVFGLIGYPEKGPLNTLHGMLGPTYERGERFFGDYVVELLGASGQALDFDEAWVARDGGGLGVVTRERYGELELDTLTVAPYTPTTPDAAQQHPACLVRLVSVRNTGTSEVAAPRVRVRGVNPDAEATGDRMVEASTERVLTTAWNLAATASARSLVVALPPLAAGAEAVAVLTHCAAEGTTPPEPWRPSEAAALDEAQTALTLGPAWDGVYPAYDLPDPRVAGFLAGMRATLTAQTASTGAVCPMSQYTRIWARDNIGPVLYQLASGDYESVGRLLDYVWGATLVQGDLQNSYDADLDLTALPPEPDWSALGPLAVRVGAETPSYLVIMYGLWYRATGDLDKARERWGLLRRSMLDVRFGPDLLLPWTGDETFRAAMNTAFGLGVDMAHHDLSFSLNSNILWLAAAKHFVTLAEALGEADDAAAVTALAAEMEQKAMPRYLLEDDCLSALIDRETLATWPAPFEDASLTPTWTGWLSGDDPRAVANVACLVERLGREPGVLQSALDPMYVNFPLLPSKEGVFTGMKPGYTLAALTDVGHPDAEAAFNALRRSVDAGGNVQEYLLFTSDAEADYQGFSVFYNEQGLEPSDYTAKFRPWEGGIDAAAALQYLLGWQPDVPAKRLSLRPHLPNGWSHARYANLRGGDQRFEVTVQRTDATTVRVTLTVIPAGTPPFETVALTWDAATPFVATDEAGAPLTPSSSGQPFGRTTATFERALTSSSLSWDLTE